SALIVPGNTCVTVPSVTIEASFGIGTDIFSKRSPLNWLSLPRLLHVFERNARQIFAELLAFPPRTSLSMFFSVRESITVNRRADESRRRIGKRIFVEQRDNIRFAVEQRDHGLNKPRVLPIRTKCREPHLPIKPRLMRLTPTRRSHHIARFPF